MLISYLIDVDPLDPQKFYQQPPNSKFWKIGYTGLYFLKVFLSQLWS